MFPIRFAMHTGYPGRSDHLDCFIDTGDPTGLVTYQGPVETAEWLKNASLAAKTELRAAKTELRFEIRLTAAFEKSDASDRQAVLLSLFSVLPTERPVFDKSKGILVRQATHRRLYLEFEGVINENRGMLRHVCFGRLCAPEEFLSPDAWPDELPFCFGCTGKQTKTK